jgi:hypothetical protein
MIPDIILNFHRLLAPAAISLQLQQLNIDLLLTQRSGWQTSKLFLRTMKTWNTGYVLVSSEGALANIIRSVLPSTNTTECRQEDTVLLIYGLPARADTGLSGLKQDCLAIWGVVKILSGYICKAVGVFCFSIFICCRVLPVDRLVLLGICIALFIFGLDLLFCLAILTACTILTACNIVLFVYRFLRRCLSYHGF